MTEVGKYRTIIAIGYQTTRWLLPTITLACGHEIGADPTEFKFWYSATKACLIALVCTITRATDVPVYWPILLIYFFTLFGITMRRQIQ